MSGPVRDPDAEAWDTPCGKCGSHFVVDNHWCGDPECCSDLEFFCAQCGEQR